MPEHKALMTMQAIVDDLAKRTKPCECSCHGESVGPFGERIGSGHTGDCSPLPCKGTGTVPEFPWLWEVCPGRSGFPERDWHLRAVMDSRFIPPCCNGSDQRVRRAETVTVDDVAQGRFHVEVAYIPSRKRWEAWIWLVPGVQDFGVGQSSSEAALRALHAAVTARDPD